MNKNRETYLDTIFAVNAASIEGLTYAGLTRAQKVHVRSLVSDRYVAAFVGDDQVTLDTEGAVVCITEEGRGYVQVLEDAGLVAEPQAVKPEVKPRKKVAKPSSKKTSAPKSPRPSLYSKPSTKTIPPAEPQSPNRTLWVAGGSQDTRTVKTMTAAELLAERMEALEQALAAVLAK